MVMKMNKKLFSTLILVTLLASVLPSLPVMAPSDPGLVGRWHFDEGIGSNAVDSSGNGNMGTLSGGKFGNALSFDGVDDYISIGDMGLTGDWTIEFWTKIGTTVPLIQYPIGTGSGSDGYGAGIFVAFEWEGDKWGVYAGSSDWHDTVKGSQVFSNVWYHIAVVKSGTSYSLFLNGALQNTGTLEDIDISNLQIGRRSDPFGYFNGIVDEVRVSNYARYTASFTKPTSAYTLPESGTKGLWHFDESVVGSLAYDSSTNDNDGTIYGAKWAGPTWTSGVLYYGLHFDGVDDYVQIPDASALEPTTLTLECWVKSNNPGIYSHIVSKDLTTAFGASSYALYTGSTGGLYFYVKSPSGYALSANAGTGIWNGQWHHIAGTFDGNYPRLYVDGVEVTGPHGNADEIMYAGQGNLLIGKYSEVFTHPSYDFCFYGDIDESRLYDGVLEDYIIHAHSHLDYEPPVADANGPYIVIEGTAINLDASASHDPDGTIVSYNWDLDNDGSYDDATGESVSHSWDDNGVYTIGLEVTDNYGLTGTDQAIVTVLNVPPTVGVISGAPPTPIQVGTPVSLLAPFTDPGILDTHTANWDWGDGPALPGTVSETDGSGSVSGSHTYAEAGVYTVTLTVTDKDNGFGTSTLDGFIIVYDPTAGFVTGGGWIYSPASAYTPNIALEGKATFGFVSKYQKGANVPTGNTEFVFHAAGFKFKSTGYEWLVVAGSKAQYKGIGIINGVGGYGFMLTAEDNTKLGNPDTFRLKIWDVADDTVILYDNGAQTPISGGSIVVHK